MIGALNVKDYAMKQFDISPFIMRIDPDEAEDEFDDGYYEGDENDRADLDYEDEEKDYPELSHDGFNWGDSIERNEDDGWFYDDDEKDDYESGDGFSYNDGEDD